MCLCVVVRSHVIWRNILCQSTYQLAITLFLVYGGASAFNIDYGYLVANGFHSTTLDEYVGTFVFNTFVWMQVRRVIVGILVTCLPSYSAVLLPTVSSAGVLLIVGILVGILVTCLPRYSAVLLPTVSTAGVLLLRTAGARRVSPVVS